MSKPLPQEFEALKQLAIGLTEKRMRDVIKTRQFTFLNLRDCWHPLRLVSDMETNLRDLGYDIPSTPRLAQLSEEEIERMSFETSSDHVEVEPESEPKEWVGTNDLIEARTVLLVELLKECHSFNCQPIKESRILMSKLEAFLAAEQVLNSIGVTVPAFGSSGNKVQKMG